MPLPTARERRLALRLRASELVGLMEATTRLIPSARRPATALRGRARDGRAVRRDHRRRGARPGPRPADLPDGRARLGAGANLLQVAPLPATHSYSSFRRTTRARSSTRSATSTGCRRARSPSPRSRSGRPPTPRSRRSRRSVASAPPEASRRPPARTSRPRSGRDWTADRLRRQGDRGGATSGASRPCSTTSGPARSAACREALHEELDFELTLEPGDGSPPVVITGQIDRIDRLPSGGIEVLDYKTGQRLGPEGRRREPPALDLRARLPGRAGPRDARAGHAVLHGECACGCRRRGRTSSWTSRGRTCSRGCRGCVPGSSRRRRRPGHAGTAIGGRCVRSGCEGSRCWSVTRAPLEVGPTRPVHRPDVRSCVTQGMSNLRLTLSLNDWEVVTLPRKHRPNGSANESREIQTTSR